MLSAPLTCCSIEVATACSTATASAPVKVVDTCTCGGTMSGNCAIGRRLMETSPAIVMRIEITIATMGRVIKNCAIYLSSRFHGSWGRRRGRNRRGRGFLCLRFSRHELGIDDHPVPYLLQSLDDDTLVRFKPLID